MSINKNELIHYISDLLDLQTINKIDIHTNWLSIDNSKTLINKIWFSVDATTYVADKCNELNVDLLISHHWIIWGKVKPTIWVEFERMRKFMKYDLALASYHLPLDWSTRYWNNIAISKKLSDALWVIDEELEIQDFYEIGWVPIWKKIIFSVPQKFEDVTKALANLWFNNNIYNFANKKRLQNVWIVSWAWWSLLKDDNLMDQLDFYITWEWMHDSITHAKEGWYSFVFWWHYETEVFWVQQLMKHIEEKYHIEVVFIDEKY